jgi:hypothetical protein
VRFQTWERSQSLFNALPFAHLSIFALVFRSILKNDFDMSCEQYILSMIDRIISVHLSDDDETPGQIDIFFLYSFTLRQFTQLRSLLLYHLNWSPRPPCKWSMNYLIFLISLISNSRSNTEILIWYSWIVCFGIHLIFGILTWIDSLILLMNIYHLLFHRSTHWRLHIE